MSCWSSSGSASRRERSSKYMPKRPPGQPRGDQRWSTFLKNHAKAILACDFFVAVTSTFRMLYVFVVIEHGTRRLPKRENPPSFGGGCARPREIHPWGLASRILACCGTRERVIGWHQRTEQC